MANPSLLKTIKGFFVSGATPSQSDFEELIDAAADASFINNGVIDTIHLPTTLDLTRDKQSSVLAGSFVGNGSKLDNLNADYINQGTLSEERFPKIINLTEPGSFSSITTDAIDTTSATVSHSLSIGQNASIMGEMMVSNTTSLSRLNVSDDLNVEGLISFSNHNLLLGVSNFDSGDTRTTIRTQLDNDEVLDIFSFDPQSGKIHVPVKNNDVYLHDEIVVKTWVNTQISASANNVTTSILADVSTRVSTLSTQLQSETTQAEIARDEIKQTLNAEETSRLQADTLLQTNIDEEKKRIDSILSSAQTDADSFAEVVALINTVDSSSGDSLTAINTKVTNNEQAIASLDNTVANTGEYVQQLQTSLEAVEDDLNTEELRAQVVEESLRNNINSERERIDGILQSSSSEDDSFVEITAKIDSLETSTTAQLRVVNNTINDQENILTSTNAAISILENDAVTLTNDVSGANQAIQSESVRAVEKETSLENNILSESEKLNDQVIRIDDIERVIRVDNNIRLGRENGSMPIHIMGPCTAEENLWVKRALVPSVGNHASAGITFPADVWGGSGDNAWIRYYSYSRESTIFEIGTSNDADDHIVLNATLGNVGVNTFSPTAKFHVNGNALATAWNITSDARLKTNIKNITHSVDKICAIRGVTFEWRDQHLNEYKSQQVGVVAQEIESVFPEVVTTDKDGFKSVDYSKIVAPLIEAIKELNERIKVQERDINDLKNPLR